MLPYMPGGRIASSQHLAACPERHVPDSHRIYRRHQAYGFDLISEQGKIFALCVLVKDAGCGMLGAGKGTGVRALFPSSRMLHPHKEWPKSLGNGRIRPLQSGCLMLDTRCPMLAIRAASSNQHPASISVRYMASALSID